MDVTLVGVNEANRTATFSLGRGRGLGTLQAERADGFPIGAAREIYSYGELADAIGQRTLSGPRGGLHQVHHWRWVDERPGSTTYRPGQALIDGRTHGRGAGWDW